MSDTQNLTTLTRLEATTLQSFIGQIDHWKSLHGDKADHVEIIYYPDDNPDMAGFEFVNNEPNNGILPRNRVTRFRMELQAWANQMLLQLTGWDVSKTVSKFVCIYKDDKFAVACEVSVAKVAHVATDDLSE